MSFPTQKFNEMVFQLLFSLDMGDSLEGDLIPFLMRELSVTRKTVRAAYQKALLIFESREKLDQRIGEISKAYELERIQRVERNILRFAFFELWSETEESNEMIISEALRLTRKFSTKEATAFVNAILDTEINESRPALSPPKEETTE